MADEEEDDAPESEEPASAKPVKKVEAKPEAKPEAEAEAEAKPVSKSVEWGIAIAMMVILVGFLFMMIHLMRSARSAVM